MRYEGLKRLRAENAALTQREDCAPILSCPHTTGPESPDFVEFFVGGRGRCWRLTDNGAVHGADGRVSSRKRPAKKEKIWSRPMRSSTGWPSHCTARAAARQRPSLLATRKKQVNTLVNTRPARSCSRAYVNTLSLAFAATVGGLYAIYRNKENMAASKGLVAQHLASQHGKLGALCGALPCLDSAMACLLRCIATAALQCGMRCVPARAFASLYPIARPRCVIPNPSNPHPSSLIPHPQ